MADPAQNSPCCPQFSMEKWDGKILEWKDKRFIMESIPTFFHTPFPPMITKVMTRMWEKVQAVDKNQKMEDILVLFHDPSAWKSEIYISTSVSVPDTKEVTLSGTFMTKVFDGPYSSVPKWIAEMDAILSKDGKKALKYYIQYAYCPACAKFYGHNYVTFFAQVED